MKRILVPWMLFWCSALLCQNIALYDQINGTYDFTMLGNTMNVQENTANDPCVVLTSSSAALSLPPSAEVSRAFLYWAGSGTGDFNVKLNGTDITAQRAFPLTLATTGLPFFGAFADVTEQVAQTGPGTYTLSDLDVSPWLNPTQYCINGANFAGWAIVVVFKEDSLPLNQINIYDGLQAVPTFLSISLNSLNVIDDAGSQIGFVAWEGDRFIANGETLSMNGIPISNPPFNPVNNAFNGTNSFTGSTTMYNMDLDVYDIQNYIAPGDTTAEITLSSNQDVVMINCVIVKLNSQLPDATASINEIIRTCDSREITVTYSIGNFDSTDPLPAGTPVAGYINGALAFSSATTGNLDIGESEVATVTVTIPASSSPPFQLDIIADDDGFGNGSVTELLENNNRASEIITLLTSPSFNSVPAVISCNLGFTRGIFNFAAYADLIRTQPEHVVTFHRTAEDAATGTNSILTPESYEVAPTPVTIYARIFDGLCFSITSFDLRVRNCPPTIYNYISANNDGVNDNFFIDGLRDIFLNFKVEIYNRWGVKIWEGNNQTDNWDGTASRGLRIGGNDVPDGTYYYILYLNDEDYPEPMAGFLYLNR